MHIYALSDDSLVSYSHYGPLSLPLRDAIKYRRFAWSRRFGERRTNQLRGGLMMVGTGEEAGSDLRCWLQMDIVAKQVCLSVHSAVLYVRGLGALPRWLARSWKVYRFTIFVCHSIERCYRVLAALCLFHLSLRHLAVCFVTLLFLRFPYHIVNTHTRA